MNISIVIPHYEKQEAFEVSWPAWKSQLEEGDEVIVVDDHSPNGFDFKDEQLRVVQPKKHEPHIYRLNTLRNFGIENAINDPVAIVDPDCIPNKKFIESAKTIFDPAILFSGLINYLDPKGNILKLNPRNSAREAQISRWIDRSPKGCSKIWGGCMFFSKKRTALIDWFDTDFDGGCGAEEYEFASKCYHSGIRLRNEPKLHVFHKWHQKRKPLKGRNILLWKQKMEAHKSILNFVTSYKPTVAVLVATLMRPYYIDQCLRGIFRNCIPVKVFLVNQGDDSENQLRALAWWRTRWAVEYQWKPRREKLARIRTEAMKEAKERGFKYLVLLDDDMTIMHGGLENLVGAAEEHPEFHAIAGWYFGLDKLKTMLGGYIVPHEDYQHFDLPRVDGITEVDYVSSGFTLMRLDPLVSYDTDYEFGWNDWDWAETLRQMNMRMAVCGDAGAYHRWVFTEKGLEYRQDPVEYQNIRRDVKRHERMANRFQGKWGYVPTVPKMWRGPILMKSDYCKNVYTRGYIGESEAVEQALARARARDQQLWNESLLSAITEITALVPSDATFILVDEAQLGKLPLGNRRSVPFLERGGQYWGPPPDDETAIREFERLRETAHFIIFAWPAFWWLDYYAELNRHLRTNFRCTLENERLIIFDLRSRALATEEHEDMPRRPQGLFFTHADMIRVKVRDLQIGVSEQDQSWWNWNTYIWSWRMIDKGERQLESLPLYQALKRHYGGLTENRLALDRRLLGLQKADSEEIARHWVRRHIDLYRKIRNEGFDENKEKMIEIIIGQRGELVVYDGHNRVSMLKHLGKPKKIKTRVRKRSPQWIEFKEKLFRLYGRKLLYQPMKHPDFEDWEVNRASTNRFNSIILHAGDVRGKTVFDIGSCTGWFSRRFAERGAYVTGVERHRLRLEISKEISAQMGFTEKNPLYRDGRFEDFLGRYVRKKKFNIVLFLSLFHHYLRRDLNEAWNAVKLISECGETMYMDLSLSNLPVKWSPELVLKHSNYSRHELLSVSEMDRPLYVYT